jgi:hypothetical protein
MSKTRSLILVLVAITPFAAACGSASEAAPAPTAKVAEPASTNDAQTTCVDVMTRARTCTDDYIPALVDIRAKYDRPAGIAEEVKADRAGVIAKAKAEWVEDSKDDAIARTCQGMIEHAAPIDVETAKGCLAKSACGDYVTCISPMFEKHLSN